MALSGKSEREQRNITADAVVVLWAGLAAEMLLDESHDGWLAGGDLEDYLDNCALITDPWPPTDVAEAEGQLACMRYHRVARRKTMALCILADSIPIQGK
jgi:hypothetical protein